MGSGIGKKCERCEEQLNYDDDFVLKEDGYEHDLCKRCENVIHFDKNNP